MGQYLPLVWFLLAAFAVLALAGLGAGGSVRGALRYMRHWSRVIVITVAAAALIWLVVGPAITPP